MPDSISPPIFSDFPALLDHIDQLCLSGKRLILTIDEYPYLAASYPAISSMLQQHIDLSWKDSHLFLILCGSSMSFMENQILGYKSPLYGRRTTQLRLKPFSFFESMPMLSAWTYEEAAILYGVTGGIPEYLSQLNEGRSADENIQELFFRDTGRLYEEPVNLMRQEMREPPTYHSILTAIAGGSSRLNEIAQKCGMETSACSVHLQNLISLGIVRKEVPVTEKETSRKTIYSLNDSMFQFWYRFVRPNQGSIAMGLGHIIYEKLVQPHLTDFMGKVFEEICRQYLFLPEVYASFPFIYGRIGRWWGTDPVSRQQEKVDLAAVGEQAILLCKCKWRNGRTPVSVARTLVSRSNLFSYVTKELCIFSKSGFEDSTVEFASDHAIRLVSFAEMVESAKA